MENPGSVGAVTFLQSGIERLKELGYIKKIQNSQVGKLLEAGDDNLKQLTPRLTSALFFMEPTTIKKPWSSQGLKQKGK